MKSLFLALLLLLPIISYSQFSESELQRIAKNNIERLKLIEQNKLLKDQVLIKNQKLSYKDTTISNLRSELELQKTLKRLETTILKQDNKNLETEVKSLKKEIFITKLTSIVSGTVTVLASTFIIVKEIIKD